MENDQQPYKTDTLFAELGNWNRQENKFREVFSDQALKDREFQKMKLQTYDQLYYKYNSKPLTRDEQVMLTMLRFQRKKMEKALYPGLLTRLLHRGAVLVKAIWVRSREQAVVNPGSPQQAAWHMQALPVPERRQQSQEAALRQMPRQYNTLRKTQRMKNHRKKGRSL